MADEEIIMNEDMTEESGNAGETKAEKFTRLAPPRINKVIGGLQSLKKLAVRSSYEYTEEQVLKMFTAIKAELEECEAAFKPKEKKDEKGFSF